MLKTMQVLLDSSRFWGAAYVASIFVFALIYAQIDKGFLQSTSSREPATEHLLSEFAEYFVENYMQACGGVAGRVSVDGWVIVHCKAFTEADGSVRFALKHDEFGARWGQSETVFKVSLRTFGFQESALRPSKFSELWAFARRQHDRQPCTNMEASTLHREGMERILRSDLCPRPIAIGFVNEEIWTRLAVLADERQGIVRKSSKNFSRMLYFSAVTATTLGYGDIAPVTPLTRNLVTVQSIVGIVLIGMFLNALAQKPLSSSGSRR